MTKNYCTTTRNYTNYSSFGGEIDIEDFSTSEPNKERINKYKDADNLQSTLKRRKETEEIALHYTLEELKEMKLVSNTNGRPCSSLTDEKWQKEFKLRKLFVTPTNKKKMGGKFSKESGTWNEETSGIYCGATNYQEYCGYINDVLRTIRSGQRDYCYFIYQITDLLRFHFNDLRTKYCDGYWEVWLER